MSPNFFVFFLKWCYRLPITQLNFLSVLFSGFQQTHNLIITIKIQNIFNNPKPFLMSLGCQLLLSPIGLDNHWTVLYFRFPKYHTSGFISYTLLTWLLPFSMLRSSHVAVCIRNFSLLLLNSIPLCGFVTLSLIVHLLEDFWVFFHLGNFY